MMTLTIEKTDRIKCELDFEHFINDFVNIYCPNNGSIPIKLYDYQKEFIKEVFENDRIILKGPIGSGKSTIISLIILHKLLFEENKKFVICSSKKYDALSIFYQIEYIYKKLPYWLKAESSTTLYDTLTLSSGNILTIKSIEDLEEPYDYIFIHNASDIKLNSESFYDYIFKYLEGDSNIIISTYDLNEHVEELWKDSINDLNTFISYEISDK